MTKAVFSKLFIGLYILSCVKIRKQQLIMQTFHLVVLLVSILKLLCVLALYLVFFFHGRITLPDINTFFVKYAKR